ncbi:MAG: PorV/PorQ family protein [Calditrichaeota bacterium]|nr:PorV/PorQ family protein [Calditrichota bacterium]
MKRTSFTFSAGAFDRIRGVVAAFLALTVATASLGREVQKVGTTSLTTLKVTTSVRAAGMGDAYCAMADDIQSIFWNPAGLYHLKGTSAAFTQINMPADIQFNTAAVARNLGRIGVVGVHLIAMNTGDMPVRTIFQPDGTGENFIAYDVIGGASYAGRLTDRFIYGANLRMVVSGIKGENYTGLLGDFGTLYETSLRTLKLGMAIQNFGPDVKYSGSYYDYLDQGRRARSTPASNNFSAAPPPTIYRIGLAFNFFEMTEVDRPEQFDASVAVEMSHPNDNRERLNIGVEAWYLRMIALRAGYKFRLANSYGYDEEHWTAGFGLCVPIPGGSTVNLDYAYLESGRLGEAASGFAETPHRFSLGINF